MVARSPPPTARQTKPDASDISGQAGVAGTFRAGLKATDPRPNPVVPFPGSPSYMQDSSRFDRDFLAAERSRKEAVSRHKEQASWTSSRSQAYARELAQQVASDAAAFHEQHLQPTGGAISNKSGDSFDILTLRYHDSPGGRQLQQKDQEQKERAMRRSMFIDRKQHPLPYNIITGVCNTATGLEQAK